jgi:hypothetical protein
MGEKLRKVYNKKWFIEVRRLWILALFAISMLSWDANRSVVLFSLAITTGSMAVFHITRKILFSYINMGELYHKALENPIGSGLIFAAIIYLMSVLVQATVLLLK